MKETPRRAAKALVEMTEGSRMETDQLTKIFKAECQTAICHDMVIVEGIKEVGLCEHHLLPIIMNITIAYVPDKIILGLSKLSRIAGYFARRLQNQERTAHLIAAFIGTTGRGCTDRWQAHVRHGTRRSRHSFDHESERDARSVPERSECS
jgi:GTP cyclohydrolase I